MAAQQLQRVKGKAEWVCQGGKRETDYEERSQTSGQVTGTNHEVVTWKSKLSKTDKGLCKNSKRLCVCVFF